MVDEISMAAIGKKEANVAFDTMNRLEDEETNWKDRWPLDPIERFKREETNWKDRQPLQESWLGLKTVVDTQRRRP